MDVKAQLQLVLTSLSPYLRCMMGTFREELLCPLCMDIYNNPKQLKCHHVFCQKCLLKLFKRCTKTKSTPTCPLCRKHINKQVEDLPAAFYINKFLGLLYGHTSSATPRGLSEAGQLALAQAQWREKRHRKSSSQPAKLRCQPRQPQPQVSDIPCISLLSNEQNGWCRWSAWVTDDRQEIAPLTGDLRCLFNAKRCNFWMCKFCHVCQLCKLGQPAEG